MKEKTGRVCEGEGARKQTQGGCVRVRVCESKHGRGCEGEGATQGGSVRV